MALHFDMAMFGRLHPTHDQVVEAVPACMSDGKFPQLLTGVSYVVRMRVDGDDFENPPLIGFDFLNPQGEPIAEYWAKLHPLLANPGDITSGFLGFDYRVDECDITGPGTYLGRLYADGKIVRETPLPIVVVQ